MATTGQQIADKAEIVLQDAANTRWVEAEILGWINDGELEVVKEKPDTNPSIASMQLAAGSEQTLPSTALQLLDVTSNMGTDGTTRGNNITVVERKLMDAIDPDWMIKTANNVVTNIVYDPKRTPKKFWVYPMSTGSNYVELITANYPTALAALANSITVGDEYATTIMHYVLFMTFSKDAEEQNSAARAIAHYNAFLTSLGIRDMKEDNIQPRKTAGSS
jgi:hypothetical protein